MAVRLGIGDFSRMTHLSVKALRHYHVFVGVLVAVVGAAARPEPVAGGYRVVLRDSTFLRLAAVNVAMIGVGWGPEAG